MNRRDDGATSILALAVVVIAALLAMLVADVGVFVAHRLQVAAAADAAALAAAPVTFRPFGAGDGAAAEAARFAADNGAQLVECRCPADPTPAPRIVTVVVARTVTLTFFGTHRLTARSSAEFDPRPISPAPHGAGRSPPPSTTGR